MNCYYCGTELIHGDNRLDNDDEYRDIYDMVTYLKCPRCGATVETIEDLYMLYLSYIQ